MSNPPTTMTGRVSNQMRKVRGFMRMFGQEIPAAPCIPREEVRNLRSSLILEEFAELCVATTKTEKLDALADLRYVILGTFAAYGFGFVDELPPLRRTINLPDLNRLLLACSPPPRPAFMLLASMMEWLNFEGFRYGFTDYQIDAAFDEVHRSNMTKFWSGEELYAAKAELDFYPVGDGKWRAVNELGKVIKSPSYSPANLKPIAEGKL